ncbi:MAG: ABC transporter ATP-binding protein [Nitrososphaerales archaeon]
MSAKLVVENINKGYVAVKGVQTKVTVLKDISFSVNEGEIVSIIGPTGCGKTTLLRIIDGIIPADSGHVFIDEKEVKDTKNSQCAMVFQNFNLFPWRNALKNVELGLESKGVSPEERRQKAEELLKLVGLGGYEKHHPHELSGGMQQRVGLARALAIDPAVVLLDEPFSSVDLLLRESLQDEVLKILVEKKKTAIFITHNVDESLFLSDRIISLAARPGRIKNIYTVDLARPRTNEVLRSARAEQLKDLMRSDLLESLASMVDRVDLPKIKSAS